MPGQPPGRAGRMWLEERLELAARGQDLLERKLHVLLDEQQRWRARVQDTATAWETACRAAELWLLRGALIGGQRAIAAAAAAQPPPAVTVGWAAPMGLRLPATAAVSFPEAAAGIPTPGNSALLAAGPAYRAAVDAAAQHAAARAALDLVEAEVATTRRRLRAIRNHWVPRLQQALSSVRLALDEEELATEVRLRWAVSLRQGPGPAGTEHGG